MFEAGPAKAAAMGGEMPLEWSDVWAYMQATQAIAEPWEARTLMDLSRAYCSGKAEGTDPLSEAPMDRG